MKVQELMEYLKAFDPESAVVTRGLDEEGYADICIVEPINLKSRSSNTSAIVLGEYEATVAKGKMAILIDHT
jgi:hypothetical protein